MSDELKKMLEYLEQIFLTAGIAANRKFKHVYFACKLQNQSSGADLSTM